MQTDPARAHVLYTESDLRSPDGWRLRGVYGACCFFFFFLICRRHRSFSLDFLPEEG